MPVFSDADTCPSTGFSFSRFHSVSFQHRLSPASPVQIVNILRIDLFGNPFPEKFSETGRMLIDRRYIHPDERGLFLSSRVLFQKNFEQRILRSACSQNEIGMSAFFQCPVQIFSDNEAASCPISLMIKIFDLQLILVMIFS
jgi:hypothetical protein